MNNRNRKIRAFSLVISLAIAAALMFPRPASLSAAGFSPFGIPQNTGTGVNASGISNELSLISPSGLSLYFMSRDRSDGLGGNDIYVSQRPTISSAWGPAQNLNVLNTTSNEAPGSISPDGREMFFTSTRPFGQGGPDIWLTTRTDPNNDAGWTAPVNLGAVLNTGFGEQTPEYFVDPVTGAGTLLFSSDRDSGTTNVKDLYKSTRNPDGTFNPPTPINVLNTPGDENRPTMSRDGLEIFFSTNRTGVREIYHSSRATTSSEWSQPFPVNVLNAGGVAAQPSLSADGTVLYFTSNRPGGIGVSDIYSVARVSVNRGPAADFDGDGQTDISIFRPSDGTWHVLESGTNTYRVQRFGTAGDKIVPGDYDGDGRIDMGVFRPMEGVWWIMRSSDGAVSVTNWGVPTDRPVPADYDGDGRTDIAVYRDGTWFIVKSSDGSPSYQQFGLGGDIPIAGGGSP